MGGAGGHGLLHRRGMDSRRIGAEGASVACYRITMGKRHDPARSSFWTNGVLWRRLYNRKKSTPTRNATGKGYVSNCFYGAGERNRTSDLLITNQLLYRLSYTGMGAEV